MSKVVVPEKWIQTKVAIGFIIIVTIAVVVFAITYFSVVSIVKVQNEDYGHEYEFTYLNQLTFEVIETEGLSRLYGVTGNSKYMDQYQQHHDSVLSVISYLHVLFPDSISRGGINKIEHLYLQKKILMDQLAQMNIKKLNAETTENIIASMPDSLNYEVKQYTYTSLKVDSLDDDVILEDTVLLIQQPEEKRGFFKRIGDLFSGGKRNKEAIVELEAVVSRKVDSTVMKEFRQSENIEEIKSKIQDAKKRKAQINYSVKRHEDELIKLDRQLTEQIKSIVSNLHNITIERNKKKRSDLEQLRSDMVDRILLLVATAVSLMLFFILWISRDISRSQKLKNDIIRAKERVDRLLKMKEQFVAHMNHEIRTPLTSIIGFSEQLLGMLKNKDELAVSKRIQLSAEHLNGLINNVLDSSMLESGKIAFYKDKIEAGMFMDELYQLFVLNAHKNSLKFSYKIDDSLNGFESDKLRLKQILINLIGNAIKFTHKGEVHYDVKVNKDKLIFTVQDTGIGIPRDKQKTIFKMFNQVNISLSRKYSGTGLGLSISRQIIEAMGGRINVESKLNEGSTFKFDIPYIKCDLDSISKLPETNYLFNDRKVMAVDDDEMICQLIDRILHDKVEQLDVISNPELAQLAIEQNKYDLLMVDLHMPKIDGLQLLKFIREKKNMDLPVLFLTADMVNSELVKANRKNNVYVMFKPFTQKQILTKLGQIFDIAIVDTIEKPKENFKKKDHDKQYSLDDVKSFTGNDDQFLSSIIQIFVENTDEGIDNIQEALLSANPYKVVSEKAHKMLTGYRQFKIEKGVQLLVLLEKSIHTTPPIEEVNQTFKELINLWKEVKIELIGELI